MGEFELSRTWSARLAASIAETWFEARREILLASRMEMDDNVWMTSSPDHMGDPAKKVDQLLHQHAADRLRSLVPGIQVFGEEAELTNLLLRTKDFRYIGYLDAIDGSAQAWSLPGAWGHVMLVQEFVGLAADGGPDCQMRFLGVLDAEGGTTFAESALPYVSVDIIDRSEGDAYSDDLELSYSEEGEKFEVTSTPVVLAGGYKPTWWQAFSTLRERVAARWPDVKVPVFNTAGAPVTRKVIQNADNVAVQLAASSLWDGATAALVSRAGGYVFEIGETEPKAHDVVWSWWSQFGYERDPRPEVVGRWRPATHIPAFVAGMDLARTRAVAEECVDLPSCT
ncbi:MAG: hypothetical protein M0R80_31935 [Proteobacteria bacterium]|nr:hypothetical protein [Pseudomonadota bacterium]